MGIARHFNAGESGSGGVHTEYLASAVSAENYAAFTCCAWIKRDYSGSRNGIMGRMNDFHNGWCFFVDDSFFGGENSGRLNFFALTTAGGGTEFTITSPGVVLDDWVFVATTYDQTSVGTEVKIWYGNTAENLRVIQTGSMTGTFSEIGVWAILFGNVTNGNAFTGGAIRGWNGSADQFGIWFAALSEDELKQAMQCGNRVQPSAIKFIVDVNGTDPEDGVAISLAPVTFTVNGTEVIFGEYVGCDYVPEGDRFAAGRPKFLLYLSADTSILPPPTPDADDAITKWPLRHFTMPEFSADVTPLLGLRGPYILASDNTQHSRIYAIDHTYKSDNGDAIRVEIESGNITHGTMNQKRCEYYRFFVKRVDGGSFTLFVNDENQGFDAGETVSLDPNETTEYVVTEVRNMGVYRNRRIKLVHSSAVDDFELVWMEEGFTVLGR